MKSYFERFQEILKEFFTSNPEEELQDPYYLCIRLAIEKKLEEEGYTKVIVKLDDSPEMINGLDGVICTGTFTKKMVEAIEIWECPVIFIDADPNPKRFDSIVVDYRRAVEEIVSYLVGCGHTKIGMIGCREVDKEGDEVLDTRIQHFQNALKKRGLYHPEYTKFGAYYAKYGYKLLKEFYEEGNLPTALFVANDSMAAGSYRAAYELGLKIPDDISIIGFNDIPTAKYMVPPLTTVRLYMEFMGEYAVKLLEERIRHPQRTYRSLRWTTAYHRMGATFRTLHCDRQLPQRRAGLPPRRDRLDGTGHVQQRIDQLRAQR